jgi:hypothetical protein
MTWDARDCDATVQLVCTGRGKHTERHIELLQRAGRRWSSYSDEFGTAKEAYDGTLSGLLNLGVQLDDKLVERNGKLDSRHRGGLRTTRHGAQAECSKCHQRYSCPGVTLYLELDKAVALGESTLDCSYL